MTPAEQLMKTLVEAWGQADLGPIRDALDENIVWKSASTFNDGVFCVGGERKGKAEVLALLSRVSINYYFQRYVAKEIVSKGEIVWGLFDAYGNYIPSGGSRPARKPIAFETAFRWRVRNGKILESQTFFDTAALLAQQGELPVAPA